MNEHAYKLQLGLLTEAGKLVQMVDVDALLDVVGKSEALGPILEPTAYQRGGGANLVDQRRFLQAAQQFRAVCAELGNRAAG